MISSHPLTRRAFLGCSAATGALWAIGCAGTSPAASQVVSHPLGPLFFPVALTGGDKQHAMAKEAGFNCMVDTVDSCLCPAESDAVFAARLAQLRALPLPIGACNAFIPGSMRITGPKADHDAAVARARIVFDRARQAGVGRIIFGSGGARRVPEGFSHQEARAQFVALLRRLAPLAEAQGVLLIPETLNHHECNFINKLPELTSIVAEVNHPAVRMNADLYHMRVEDEDPGVLTEAIPWLAHVEIGEKAKRTIPGVEGDDFTPFFRVLLKHGWSGMLNVECGATLAQARRMFPYLGRQIRDAQG